MSGIPDEKDKRIVTLNIPDEYEFIDPGLIRLLDKTRLGSKAVRVVPRIKRERACPAGCRPPPTWAAPANHC